MANEPSRKYFMADSLERGDVAAIAGQNVRGDGAGLQADERGHQFGGAGHHAHAHGGEKNQRVVFAVLDVFAVEIIGRADDHQERDGFHHHVHEDAEAVDAQQARERFAGMQRRIDRGDQRQPAAQRGERHENRPARASEKRFHQHQHNPGERQDDLRQQAQHVFSRRKHQRTPPGIAAGTEASPARAL